MKLLKWVVAIVVCAWLGQYALALALPSLVMETLYALGTKQQGYNQLAISELPDEEFRTIVRPSPDLLYASCFYNLENGPVVIEAHIPSRYWSMQFYQMNTDNYAGITNQRDERYRTGSTVNVTLIGSDESPNDFAGEVIQSPTQRGIMLLRASAIGDRDEQQAALLASRCEPATR
ncbi:MAG: DUF1254 domain-containing protein [Halioglobus sp.]|nr:DUF1254 domain-containing protein [Halioglobus sp.]